jgi:dCMP deaminase
MVKKPSWDDYYINIADAISKRSPDPEYKVGAVVVSNNDNRLLGTGYNGFPIGFDESKIDWSDRDTARPYIIHAEKNALDYTTDDLTTARMYLTLSPCDNCVKLIYNRGIKKIIFRDIYHKTIKITEKYCLDNDIELVQHKYIYENNRS